MIQEAERLAAAERELEAANKAPSKLWGGGSSKKTSKSVAVPSKDLPDMDAKIIYRMQLQRLLDDSPEIRDVLGAKRAIDVIRRFRTKRGRDPYAEISTMQEAVILKMDDLEKIGLNLEFKEVETLNMVSNALNDALTEVQNQWRMELTQLLETCSGISNHLIDLTDRLAACTEKHNEIARDINTQAVMP